MAVVLKDRVKETTSTAGTSDFVLGGAASGYQAFSVIGADNYTYYCCFDNATGDWEVGYGQYTTTAGGTLVRNTILSNSAATTSKIDFAAGPKEVFLTYPAEKGIYEELNGNTLIDGGPLTVIGQNVTGYTTFDAALAELYADVNSFAQIYAQNLNDGSDASTDIVAYNDLGDGSVNFIDMGISSSNYTSEDYPIFTPNSGYLYNDGGELLIGSATDDVVLFAGGVDTTDEAARIDKTTKALTTVADVNVGGALDVTGAAEFGSTVLLNQDPTLALQAATKQYVDNATSNGFHVHTPVLVATTGNLTATYNQPGGAGVGVGATLTNSGTQVALEIDGVAMTVADRVLVWEQTTGTQNGIYTVTTVGNGSTNWVLTRATDADEAGEGSPDSLGGGDYFFVNSGATYGFFSFVCTNTDEITFGTSVITFTEFSQVPSYNVVAPLNLSGNTLSLTGTVAATNGGTGTATVTTGDLLYGSGTNTWGKLAAGGAYRSLVMNAGGTQVEWNAVALNQSGAVSGSLPAINGGTGQAAYSVGDVLYSGTTDTLSRLAGNTTTTKKFLGQTGTGSASAAPSWQQPAATDITGLAASATTDTTNASNISSGTLGTARLSGSYTGITGVGTLAAGTWNGSTIGATYGGTGQSSYAVGDLLYASTTTAVSKLADVAVGNALISGGVGSAPSYGKIGLATHVSGTLPIANGGTGSTSTQFVALGTNVSGTLPVANGGTGVTTSTGSGNNVLSTSPTLVTPALGTPSSGNLANCTFPTLNQNTTGSSGSCTGNAATATNLSTGRTNWSTNGTISAVVGQLAWKNYGNSHTIFDASASTSPDGTSVNNTNPGVAWSGTYPTLMGWNGSSTYGVRVDSSRYSDSASTLNGYTQNASSGANTIVQRDGSGYIQNNYFYTSGGGSERNASGMGYFAGFNSSDYYIRSYTAAAVATLLSGQSMNISGSSTSCSGTAYLATAVQYLPNRTDGSAYPVLWGAAYTSGSGTIAYSCAAVTITSSSGTLTATTLTASSDETLKTNWRGYEPDFVEQLAKVKHGTYDRLDCEVTQDGASAQSLLNVLPNSVWEDAETKKLSINYGGAAMVSAIQLAQRVVEQDERIAKLEAIVAKLTKQGT